MGQNADRLVDDRGFAYLFHNPETGEAIVGSTNNAGRRKGEHVRALEKNAHPNPRFQEAYNKNRNFDFVSIPLTDREEAFDFEQAVLDDHFNEPTLLNLSHNARACRINHTDETKEKIRQATLGKNIGRKASPETLQKMSAAHLGVPLTMEHRRKLSEAQTGREVTVETRNKIAEALTGKIRSPEAIEKSRQAIIGKPLRPEHIEAIRQAKLGKPKPPEMMENLRVVNQVAVKINGVVYASMSIAAQSLGIGLSTVHARVNRTSDRFIDWQYL